MESTTCIGAATLPLTTVTQENQARADQLRAIVSLAENYIATIGSTIDDDFLDELVEQTVLGGSFGTTRHLRVRRSGTRPLRGCSPAQARTILSETLNLDAKCVDDTVTQIAGILHQQPGYTQPALGVFRSTALGIMDQPVGIPLHRRPARNPPLGVAEPFLLRIATLLIRRTPVRLGSAPGNAEWHGAACKRSRRMIDGTGARMSPSDQAQLQG